MQRSLVPSVGVIALLTASGSFVLNIIFAVELSPTRNSQRISAIVASAVLLINLGFLPLSIFHYVRNHGQNEKTSREQRMSFIFLTALATTLFFAVATTLVTLIWMQICLESLPSNMLGSSTRNILVVAFALCSIFTLFQSIYLVLLGVQARQAAFESRVFNTDIEQSISSMQQSQRPGPALGRYSHSAPSSPISSAPGSRKRSSSDAFSSIRSSLSNSIRPMTSRTRLLSRLPSTKSARSSMKESRDVPPPIDTSLTTPPYTEDGFDSWDTSAVSQDSRQTISDSSPQSPFSMAPKRGSNPPPFSLSLPPVTLSHSHSRTFLPTIPGSPVVSRTPSPAFALDFKPVPPIPRHRSRSQSPANSFRSTASNRRRSSLVAPPLIPDPAEAHIHPLFRSDSPTPPPAVSTPGTSVTAAPNAGYMISESDRASLKRMRSDSMTSSPSLVRLEIDSPGDMDMDMRRQQPMMQQQLLDGANRKLMSQMERGRDRRISSARDDERNSMSSNETEGDAESENNSFEGGGEQERKTSAAIPEWILSGNPRNSMCGYRKRTLGSTVEEESEDGMK